ncbi:LysR family transcriptional regulator [Natranaerofaba carboxydovora]|uniref:LysR family transcriptional regulator n=1 Tax=Natranaerofaba carboxydovora TaxID=2742683 RepID=UPI001F1382DA|nr:LysR family transcriptional regulator [Natranaerofaba carboxydovora]UMZ75069.1 HTH-type transcriptional regulator CysL [Natranaerofaba carboxydovora]
MNLETIRAFMVVVEEGSITKASRELHLSQPALSSQINYLEKYFKTPLLNRTTKGVSLTPAGEILYLEGGRLLNILSNIESKINDLASSNQETLKVAASNTIGGYAVPCSIYIFKEKYPKNEIDLDVYNSPEVINQVLDGNVQMGLIEGPISSELRKKLTNEGLALKRLGNDYIELVAPYKEPWIDRDHITVSELAKYNLILKEKGSGIRATIEKNLADQNISLKDLNVVLEINNISSIISAVSADKGLSFLPRMAIKKEIRHKTLKIIKLQDVNFPHTFTMVYKPKDISEGITKQFFDLLISDERGFC